MNKYIGFYKGKQYKVEAEGSYKAQLKLAGQLGVKKSYMVSVYLVEKDGKEIIQSTCF